MPQVNAKTILAFDVGLKRTGVAVGSMLTGNAEPAGCLAGNNGQMDWQGVDSLIERWQPTLGVIGDPNTEDPHLNKLIRRLIHHLQKRRISVTLVDETLTSVAANAELQEAAVTHHKKVRYRDQIAACIILENYLSANAASGE